MKYDIYLVGVGGQGILAIGEVITQAALQAGIPANFYPTKGMAQRGGFVKAQLRLGRKVVGPKIPEKGADLAVAMEVSEALKAVRFIRPRGDFLLYGQVWKPTAVLLGKDPYPSLDQVLEQICAAGATAHYLDPAKLPLHDGRLVPANIFVMGAAIGRTSLRALLSPEAVLQVIEKRWKRSSQSNRRAFEAGSGGA
jgi:indolepyruvate ferredoxin oxidoreductase beta subunit